MPIAMDKIWLSEFEKSIEDALEQERLSRAEAAWNRYEFDLGSPRQAHIATRIRDLMDDDYRQAEEYYEAAEILNQVYGEIQQYRMEDEVDNY